LVLEGEPKEGLEFRAPSATKDQSKSSSGSTSFSEEALNTLLKRDRQGKVTTVETDICLVRLPRSTPPDKVDHLATALANFSDNDFVHQRKDRKRSKNHPKDPPLRSNVPKEDHLKKVKKKKKKKMERKKKELTVVNIEIEGIHFSLPEKDGFTLEEPPDALSPRSRAAFAQARLKEASKGQGILKSEVKRKKKKKKKEDGKGKKKSRKKKKRKRKRRKQGHLQDGESDLEEVKWRPEMDEADENFFPTLATLKRRRKPYLSVNKPVPCSICQVII